MKRTNIHLSEPQLAQLGALAQQTGLSVAELIRRAIDEYLKGKARGKKSRQTQQEAALSGAANTVSA